MTYRPKPIDFCDHVGHGACADCPDDDVAIDIDGDTYARLAAAADAAGESVDDVAERALRPGDRCRVYDTECLSPAKCSAEEVCCAGDVEPAKLTTIDHGRLTRMSATLASVIDCATYCASAPSADISATHTLARAIVALDDEMPVAVEQSLLSRAMIAELDAGSADECDCGDVPNVRHLDPDGHLPGCPESNAYALHLLQNLLAVIHGDGGHYSDEHGIKKAVADAEAKYLSTRSALRDLLAAYPRLSSEFSTAEQQRAVRAARAALGGGK